MSDQRVPNRDINAVARVTLALSLRAQKMPFDQIARQCGYKDESGARKAVKRELHRIVVQGVDEMRMEELHMLDTLQAIVWEQIVIPPDEKQEDEDEEKPKRKRKKSGVNLFAVDRILAISERRCKLMGLDVKPDTIPDGTTIIREYGVEVSRV